MKIIIIMVRPRNPQNIGAAARAMGNFGISDLRVVAPYPPVWQEVKTAVHAEDIIKKARVFATLGEALHDANFTFATTAMQKRKTNRKIVPLPAIGGVLGKGKTAIVFGPEKTGLAADEIALADAVLNIPTSAKTPSINLAQAVALCCYELSKLPRAAAPKAASVKLSTFKEKQLVLQNIEALLGALALPPTLGKKVRQKRLQDIAAAGKFSKESIFFINSLVAKVLDKLAKG